jgi:hypothetical protein
MTPFVHSFSIGPWRQFSEIDVSRVAPERAAARLPGKCVLPESELKEDVEGADYTQGRSTDQ